jgi:hypothetical protein
VITVIVFIKDATTITIFIIKRFIDHRENPNMRPGSGIKKFRKVEKVGSLNIKNYLVDPNDEGIDEDGNTSVH